jgi:hypothetical protein
VICPNMYVGPLKTSLGSGVVKTVVNLVDRTGTSNTTGTTRQIKPLPFGSGLGMGLANGGDEQWIFAQSGTLVNLRQPWTIASVQEFNGSLPSNTEESYSILTCSTFTPTVRASSYDRAQGITPAGKAFSYIFDGAAKRLTGNTTMAQFQTYATVSSVGTDNLLRLYLNGVEDATALSVSNRGFAGYSAAAFFVACGTMCPTQTANQPTTGDYSLVIRLDGYAYGTADAERFADNPWQIFPRLHPSRQRTLLTASAPTFNAAWNAAANSVISTGARAA